MVVEVAVELVHNKLLMFNEAENSSGFKMIENRLKEFKNHVNHPKNEIDNGNVFEISSLKMIAWIYFTASLCCT